MEAPPVINPARLRFPWLFAGGLLLAAAAAGAVLFEFNPSHYGFYPRCLLYVTTGIYCPGCGAQRALYQLLHGHLATALRCNLLVVLALPLAGFSFTRYARSRLAGGPASIVIPPLAVKLAVGLILAFSILRNIPCAPFNYLAPP